MESVFDDYLLKKPSFESFKPYIYIIRCHPSRKKAYMHHKKHPYPRGLRSESEGPPIRMKRVADIVAFSHPSTHICIGTCQNTK